MHLLHVDYERITAVMIAKTNKVKIVKTTIY